MFIHLARFCIMVHGWCIGFGFGGFLPVLAGCLVHQLGHPYTLTTQPGPLPGFKQRPVVGLPHSQHEQV